MIDIDILIEGAIERKATDIHLRTDDCPRLRIDTVLKPDESLPYIAPEIAAERIILKQQNPEILRQRLRENREIDVAFSSVSGARVRANIYKCESGLQIALRIIPAKRLTAEQIGLPFPIADICRSRSGLFLITGANGSGKTSTLASMIDIINASRNVHILTIEDPIEYVFKNEKSLVSQREIGRDSGSFYEALRMSVRENPDVVVLGEMRDLETTRTAIELSETGHLVFATLHTRTATSAIDRLIGQFPAAEQQQIRLMIADNLIGVLSQTLLPKRAGGLIAAFEFLNVTPAVRNLIREQKVPQIFSIIQMGAKQGMCTMEDSIANLKNRGII